jgi:predicted DNA-binding protein
MSEQEVVVSTRLPPDLARKLQEYCEKHDITPSFLLRSLIEKFLIEEQLSTGEDFFIQLNKILERIEAMAEGYEIVKRKLLEMAERKSRAKTPANP